MAELVDALVSGTSDESRGGSSPLQGTKFRFVFVNGAVLSSEHVVPAEMPVRCKVLDIFHHFREDDSLSWDEKGFMEYLIKPNGKPVDGSLKGKRYKNRFINQ
jgi:hypothetical protein